MMYNLLRINVLMNIYRKLLSSAVFSCSLIVLKSLMHSYQCMHCACMLRLNSPETCLFINIWPSTNVWPICWQASKSWPNSLKLDVRGGGWFIPFIVIPTRQKITSFYLHKHGQVLSKTCFHGMVPLIYLLKGVDKEFWLGLVKKSIFRGYRPLEIGF